MRRAGTTTAAVCLGLFPLILDTAAAPAAPDQADHVQAELVPETQSIQAGTPFYVAVRLVMAPDWHTYWRYAGDAGLPTHVQWDLPPGFSAGDIEWPYPEAIVVADLVNLGYEGEVLLPTLITPPKRLAPSEKVTLRAKVDWLVCKEACIPGSAELSLSLPVSSEAPQRDEDWAEAFTETRQHLPVSSATWQIQAQLGPDELRLELTPPETFRGAIAQATLYPHAFGMLLLDAPQTWSKQGRTYVLTAPRDPNGIDLPDRLEGTLISDASWVNGGTRKAMEISVPYQTVAASAPAPSPIHHRAATLLLAFLGGLILNLMPCVFPVLGLKIVSFVNQAGESHAAIRRHGWVFALGVLVSFWILSGILIALRASGEELGWGFQLQSPAFVFSLAMVLLIFALNLSGLFEVGSSMTAIGGRLTTRSGLTGSFFTGVLATAVATPCAAPVLAPAIGVALTLTPIDSLLVFTAIALGLSAPYLLLSIVPRLVAYLPKPGPWMETFKQLMAFLLYASVGYLVWVLAGQVEEKALLLILFALVLAALAAWIYGRWSTAERRPGVRLTARAAALLVLAASLSLGFTAQRPSILHWETWSPQRVAELQAQGRRIYVDFTARWCATCQVNKGVLHSPQVAHRLLALNVAMLKADWTNQDPAITEALAAFERSAVPVNVYYAPDRPSPVLLPEVLTPSIVLDAIGGT